MEHPITGLEFIYCVVFALVLSGLIIGYVNGLFKGIFRKIFYSENDDVADRYQVIDNINKVSKSTSKSNHISKTIVFDSSLKLSIEFFDNYLKTKFEFYLINDLMPSFITNKEINSTLIFDIKQKFFVDISTSLNEDFLENLASVYTKPGLQLYIHQTFLNLFNKSQTHFKDNNKTIDKRIVDAAMGE